MIEKELSKERITEIVSSSSDAYECLLNLYNEVLPVSWKDVKSIFPWKIQTNRKTAEFILEAMHSDFTGHDGDPWIVNSLILNKGFSASHEEVDDWKVRVEDDAYILNEKEKE